MKKLAVLLLFFSATAFGQETETRKLSSFDAIDVSEGIDLILTEGSPEARIEISGAETKDVITDVSGTTLRIEMRGKKTYNNVKVTVYVQYQGLTALEASSAADVVFESVFNGQALSIEASSAASVRATLSVEDLEVDISSAAKVNLDGSAGNMQVDISSAGSLSAGDLVCKQVGVDVSSGGNALVHVTGQLNADASSGGKVRYKGNPEKVFADSNSGGRVKKY